MLSWKGGRNNSKVYSCTHRLSMTMLSTYCHSLSAMSCLMNFQLSLKQGKQFSIYHLAKPLVQTQYLQRFIKLAVHQWQRKLQSCFPTCGGRGLYHKNSRMHPKATYASGQEILQSVTTIGAGHSSIVDWSGKILAKMLLNRLNEPLGQAGLLSRRQCGFRKDRGIVDMIFTARQLQEKCEEHNVDLYMTFVDFTKAPDTFSQLWWALENYVKFRVSS